MYVHLYIYIYIYMENYQPENAIPRQHAQGFQLPSCYLAFSAPATLAISKSAYDINQTLTTWRGRRGRLRML